MEQNQNQLLQCLNRIAIKGRVGRINLCRVDGKVHASMSVATGYAYKSPDGGLIHEVMWFNVSAFETPKITCLEEINKYDFVHIIGRIRNRTYTDNEGNTRNIPEVIARSVEVLANASDYGSTLPDSDDHALPPEEEKLYNQ